TIKRMDTRGRTGTSRVESAILILRFAPAPCYQKRTIVCETRPFKSITRTRYGFAAVRHRMGGRMMAGIRGVRLGGFVLAALFALCARASAQDAGVAGVVKDNSGAVLPGVTVTISSPVMIEQERTAVTNAEGRYIFTQLRPGVYKVTFTLPGFSTVVREGITLSAGFTATVDGDLRVG